MALTPDVKLEFDQNAGRQSAGSPLSDRRDAVRAEVDYIVSHPSFEKATRLSRLLRYLVEKTLDGHSAALKEYLLGLEVFDRGPDFDPRVDTIVRVEARRLRLRLEAFYRQDQRERPLRIRLVRGTYAPEFDFPEPAPQPEPASKIRWRTLRVAIVPALLVVAVWLGLLLIPMGWNARKSLALLPLKDLSGAQEAQSLAEGLRDEVANQLMTTSQIRIVTIGAPGGAGARPGDWQDVEGRFGVTHVLAGDIRKDGDRMRVTARLVRTKDGAGLWSETFERDSRSLFDVEDDLAVRISSAVRIRLGGSVRTDRRHTSNAEARRLFLTGRHYWNQRSMSGLVKSMEYFEEALARDPNYALARSALADALIVGSFRNHFPPTEAIPKAREAARKALELEPSLGEAQAASAYIRYFYDWDFAGADKEFRRSLDLAPNYPTARQWYGLALLTQSRFDRALEELREAQAMDLLSLVGSIDIAAAHYYRRRYDQAVTQARATLELEPDFFIGYLFLGGALQYQGRAKEAVDAIEKAGSLSGEDSSSAAWLARALVAAGQPQRARAVLEDMRGKIPTHRLSNYHIAGAHAALGEIDLAMQDLELARQRREAFLMFLQVDPALDPLRRDPRLAALARRIGFGR